jgi:hypothetical protein
MQEYKAMGKNVTQKLIESHLVEGRMIPGEEISLKIDQTLTQDATGTLVMLEFEVLGIPRVRTELSAQYVDHNLLQEDFKNADDHLFLRSSCKKFGLWYSRPGNGVGHPIHMERFGVPGKTLLGSDSHTCAAGSLGMLAIGAGGLEVAMAGEPFCVTMPIIWGVKLMGELPDWVSAKDVILEILRPHNVDGGLGKIVEYYGPGLESLTAMDRHVIANMGAELGATTSVLPTDGAVKAFLKSQGRKGAFREILADKDAEIRRIRRNQPAGAGTPDCAAQRSGQGDACARSGGEGNLPGLHRIFRQSWAAQVRNLFSLAEELRRMESLKTLLGNTLVASIGSVCSKAMKKLGVVVGIEARPPKLRPFVQSLDQALSRR